MSTMGTMMRGSEGHLGVVPCKVGEDTILYVAAEIALLGEWVSILLRVNSPSKECVSVMYHAYLMFLRKKRGRLSLCVMVWSR